MNAVDNLPDEDKNTFFIGEMETSFTQEKEGWWRYPRENSLHSF